MSDPLTRSPYFFAARRPFRQQRLMSYIHREHQRGRTLMDIVDDDYVHRCGSRELVWQTVRETPLIELLKEDVIEAIQRASAAVSNHE